MDEGRVQRRRHQLVAVLRRHLDEIAEHVVVADLQALDAGLVGVARLHRGDDEARGVAQIAGLIERGFVAFAHEAAVALDQRQLLGQRAFEFARQIARRAGAAPPSPAAISCGGSSSSCKPRQRLIGGEDAVAQALRDRAGRRVRPTAAPARATCRARARSMLRISSRAALSATNAAIASSRRAIAALSVSGAASRCASSREPAGGHGAVDGIEQRAAPFAGQRARQFEIGAGGGIDRHGGAGGFARRRRQRRAFADLGAVDIGDGGGGGGRFQPRHRAASRPWWRPRNNRTAAARRWRCRRRRGSAASPPAIRAAAGPDRHRHRAHR